MHRPPVEDEELPPEDLVTGQSDVRDEARMNLFFLNRDIRRLSAEDPNRWFDFILALIAWKQELDPDLTPSMPNWRGSGCIWMPAGWKNCARRA